MVGLKLVAAAIAEESSALNANDVSFSKDLYLNGTEYILRGLPPNLTTTEKAHIHSLLRNLQPLPHHTEIPYQDEPYPFLIFLFRQLGYLLKRLTPHIQSFAVRIVEFEKQHNLARGLIEMSIGIVERGVDIAVKLGLNEALINFGTALGRGVGEGVRVYRSA